jgi:hypothetical protein
VRFFTDAVRVRTVFATGHPLVHYPVGIFAGRVTCG